MSVLKSYVNLGEQQTTRLAPQSAELAFRALEVDYVLTTDVSSDPLTPTPTPSNPESSTRPSATAADQVKKDQVIDLDNYAKDNKTIHGHLLNHMSDLMFDLFVAQKSAKDIWSTLESRYEGDNAGRKNMLLESGCSSR
ncbi:ty1-copia retrotransposon protein [Cucumis melo var. makuwa]|uniref:Ty1-copia retrotransposon protein n=1 Tax=Cucumis melo var. makuwa TaxID=1194695 RepID=A0A5A7UPN1_CUCMM|nr:ty1-copia retrotransposon protein [Cucumis melo var. makuwa]TYK24259.1 ty1-copia retrotransposon protein [Cucumis melo var. makuwa]